MGVEMVGLPPDQRESLLYSGELGAGVKVENFPALIAQFRFAQLVLAAAKVVAGDEDAQTAAASKDAIGGLFLRAWTVRSGGWGCKGWVLRRYDVAVT